MIESFWKLLNIATMKHYKAQLYYDSPSFVHNFRSLCTKLDSAQYILPHQQLRRLMREIKFEAMNVLDKNTK